MVVKSRTRGKRVAEVFMVGRRSAEVQLALVGIYFGWFKVWRGVREFNRSRYICNGNRALCMAGKIKKKTF